MDAVLQLVVQVIFDEGGQLFHRRHDAALDVQDVYKRQILALHSKYVDEVT